MLEKNSPSLNNFSPPTQTPTPNEPVVIRERSRTFKRFIILLLFLAVLSSGGGFWYFRHIKNDKKPAQQTSNLIQPETKRADLAKSLLQQSGNNNGIAIGYLKKQTASKKTSLNTHTLQDLLLPKAAAQESENKPATDNTTKTDKTGATDSTTAPDNTQKTDDSQQSDTNLKTASDQNNDDNQETADDSRSAQAPPADNLDALKQYDPIIFFTKDQNIYSLNTISKGTAQITHDTGSSPVFSSITQQLAYEKSCSVYATPLPQTAEAHQLIVEGQDLDPMTSAGKDIVCYTPIAWSPDGSKLAIGGSYSLNNSEIGLVSFTDIYIYDVNTKKIEKYDPPKPYNTTRHFFWADDAHIAAQYIESGQFAKTIKEDPYLVNIADKSASPLILQSSVKLDQVQAVGGLFYAFSETQSAFMAAPTIDGTFSEVVKTNGKSGTFLLKADETNNLSDLIMLNGQPGAENNFKLLDFKIGSGEMTELYSPPGFSAYMLGWGQNFDEVIYMAVLSGKSEIQQYSISSGKYETLVADLPLIQ